MWLLVQKAAMLLSAYAPYAGMYFMLVAEAPSTDDGFGGGGGGAF